MGCRTVRSGEIDPSFTFNLDLITTTSALLADPSCAHYHLVAASIRSCIVHSFSKTLRRKGGSLLQLLTITASSPINQYQLSQTVGTMFQDTLFSEDSDFHGLRSYYAAAWHKEGQPSTSLTLPGGEIAIPDSHAPPHINSASVLSSSFFLPS